MEVRLDKISSQRLVIYSDSKDAIDKIASFLGTSAEKRVVNLNVSYFIIIYTDKETFEQIADILKNMFRDVSTEIWSDTGLKKHRTYVIEQDTETEAETEAERSETETEAERSETETLENKEENSTNLRF